MATTVYVVNPHRPAAPVYEKRTWFVAGQPVAPARPLLGLLWPRRRTT